MSRTYLRNHRIDGGIPPLEQVTGETIDISNYLEFGFYDRVWYQDNVGLSNTQPGRWLGVAKNVSSVMTYYILQEQNGRVVARSTVWSVTALEMATDEVKATFDAYDKEIKRRIDDNEFPDGDDKVDPSYWTDSKDPDVDFREEFLQVFSDDTIREADNNDQEKEDPSPGIADNEYLRMELSLPSRGDTARTIPSKGQETKT